MPVTHGDRSKVQEVLDRARREQGITYLVLFDRKGRIRHDGGIVSAPGMCVMGLPFMRRRKSSFIDGAGDDAADLAAHLSQNLNRAAA